MKNGKLFRNGIIMKIIIMAVVILIPIIYSFFYLKSYWDPYGDLTGMNIAVVNLDEGADGKNQGNEFITSLKDSKTFNICEVSKEKADKGMEDGDYYATITIPKDFTKCLNSASSEDKQIATVTYSPNQATNYLGTQIINSAIKTIELNLEEKINKEVTATLAEKLEEVPSSLQDISDGANQILEGSEDLQSGLNQLNDGTNTLSNSYIAFDNGIKSAYQGGKTLSNGIDQITNGANTLDSAVSQINEGANQLSSQGAEGIQALTTGIGNVKSGATYLNSQLSTYVNGADSLASGTSQYLAMDNYLNPQILEILNQVANSSDTELAQKAQSILNTNYIQTEIAIGSNLKNGADQLIAKDANGVQNGTKLKAGAQSLADGTTLLEQKAGDLNSFISGISSLQAALNQVQTGTKSLQAGVAQLKSGSVTLTNGLETLDNSSTTVKEAIDTISNGTNSAYTGSVALTDGVNTFKTTIDEGIDSTEEELKSLNGISEFASNPVNLETKPYGEVKSYGVAFTPLFLCIGLWVGALMSYVVLYYDQRRRFGHLDHEEKNKFLQNALYLGIGAIQGIITAVLLKLGLGFEVENVAMYYGVSILLGIVFTSIIQFLIRNFGDVGKFLALIILVLQLAAAGGTFPVETIDKGFQAISPYLPMTYAIKLLREILVPTAANFKAKYIGILVSFTVVALILTYIVDYIKKKKEEKTAN